jgi:hypothetical protein
MRGGELLLVKKFSEVEDFIDLVFWEGLDELVEFFGGGHDFSGVNGFVLLLWLKGLWLSFTCIRLVRRRLVGGHSGIQLEEFFEAFSLRERAANGVVFEAATDVDAFEHFVVAIALIRGMKPKLS